MKRKTPNVSEQAKTIGQGIHDEYKGLWGFVDARIREAIIAAAVMQFESQRGFFWQDKSADDLVVDMRLLKAEVARYLAVRHLMWVSDAAECEID
jgi:hypothetical protein